jgi:hypothetical protein
VNRDFDPATILLSRPERLGANERQIVRLKKRLAQRLSEPQLKFKLKA